MANYFLTCYDDSSEEDYDTTWECFIVQIEEHDDTNVENVAHPVGVDPAVTPPPVPLVVPPQGGDQRLQALAPVAQLDELDVKIKEDL